MESRERRDAFSEDRRDTRSRRDDSSSPEGRGRAAAAAEVAGTGGKAAGGRGGRDVPPGEDGVLEDDGGRSGEDGRRGEEEFVLRTGTGAAARRFLEDGLRDERGGGGGTFSVPSEHDAGGSEALAAKTAEVVELLSSAKMCEKGLL